MNNSIMFRLLGAILFFGVVDFTYGGRANRIDIYRQEVFDYAVVRNRLPVVVYFTKSSCIPCKRVLTGLEEFAKNNSDKMYLAIADLDKLPKLKDAFQISSIPTTRGFYRGQMIDEVQGLKKLSILALAEKTLQSKQ